MKQTTKEFKYDLTIGMIFRDDIKYIRNCLETMRPLFDACKCQLIMTDTGSVDGSRDVAEEFADILLDFEWCDDFSAARNTGTEIAEGRWFAYFDTDHEFDESILEIAKFLKTKESHTVESANITIRDYHFENERKHFHDQIGVLLWNFEHERRHFDHIIHEGIERREQAGPDINTIVHHWGYTGANLKEKRERNATLLEHSIAADPTNVHQQLQYITCISDSSERVKRALTAIELGEKHHPEARLLYSIYAICGHDALLSQNWPVLVEMAEKMKDKIPNSTIQIEYYAIEAAGAHGQKQYEKAVEYFEKYISLFNEREGKTDPIFTAAIQSEFVQKRYYYTAELLLIESALALGRVDYAKEKLEKTLAYTYYDKNNNYINIKQYVEQIKETNSYHLFGKVYRHLWNEAFTPAVVGFQSTIKSFEQTVPEEHKDSFYEGITCEVIDGFTALFALKSENYQISAFTPHIVSLFQDEEDFHYNPSYIALFYVYLISNEDPTGFVERNESSHLIKFLTVLFKEFPDLIKRVEAVYNDPNFILTSLKQEKIWAYVGMRATLHLAQQETPDLERINALYSKSLSLMHGFVNKIYNPFLLSDEGISVLPGEELFTIYGMDALQAKNPLEMVKSLKKCMAVCPSYSPVIKLFLTNLPKMEPVSHVKSETTNLGEQIKGTIQLLIQKGETEQAKLFLEKYKAISPNDPEIAELQSKL